jgi:hypothetical protein
MQQILLQNSEVLADPLQADSGYDCAFVNRDADWKGHLFGSQYSLDARYGTQEVWLLACNGTTSMQDVASQSIPSMIFKIPDLPCN